MGFRVPRFGFRVFGVSDFVWVLGGCRLVASCFEHWGFEGLVLFLVQGIYGFKGFGSCTVLP